MIAFLKNSIWDLALCIVASTALCFTVCSAFYATQPYQDAPGVALMAGGCAALTLALLMASRSLRAMLVGALAIFAAIVGVLVACFQTSTAASALEDVAGNNVYLALCVVASSALVFVLSRWRAGAVALIVVGVFACATVEYLYFYGHVAAFAVFLVSAVALYAYRTYQVSLLNSESEHLAFGSVTFSGIALAAVAVACAAGLFALAIAPLDPPNLVVKLFTEEYRADEVEVRGVGDITSILNNQLLSNLLNNRDIESGNAEGDEENRQNNEEVNPEDESREAEGGSMGMDGSGDSEDDDGASLGLHFADWLPFVIAGLVILLVVLAIVAKKLLRRRRFRTMRSQENAVAAAALYRFFLGRFGKAKVPQPNAMTLAEYTAAFAGTFERFEQGGRRSAKDVEAAERDSDDGGQGFGGAAKQDAEDAGKGAAGSGRGSGEAGRDPGGTEFAALTRVYAKSVYGKEPVSEDDIALFDDYYHLFYRRLRKYMGNIRYCLRYFSL